MEDRGPNRRKKSSGKLSVKSRSRIKKIAQLIANPNDPRSLKDKCESEGLTDETFRQMLNDRKFLECVNRLLENYTELERSQIWTALIKEAKTGDIRAIKLYFELKKESKEKMQGPEAEEIAIKWLNDESKDDEKNFHQLPSDCNPSEVPRLKKPVQAPESGKKGG